MGFRAAAGLAFSCMTRWVITAAEFLSEPLGLKSKDRKKPRNVSGMECFCEKLGVGLTWGHKHVVKL